MAELPNVRLMLSNRPENVALVRQALTGLAEGLGLKPTDFDHINTAVAEACNNVVLHAYGGEAGPLEVEMHVSPQALRVVVRDHGSGIRPRMEASEQADGGIGLPMIRALSNSVELRDLGGDGTEVHMEFATPTAVSIQPLADGELLELADGSGPEHADTTTLAIAPTPLARTVLPRILCSLAARASFSTERIADTQLLADSLLGHLDGSAGAGHLGFEMSITRDKLEMRMGPLNPGGAAGLMADCAADGARAVIERLIDVQGAGHSGASELLALRLVDRG
jgi:serine/threonine-protein kinase RsbW